MQKRPIGRWLLWAVIAGALLVQTFRYVLGHSFYGEYVHWTGAWSVHLLIITVAVTPLRLLFPKTGWTGWLMRQRRDFGLAMFLYASAHTLAYLVKQADFERIVSEGLEAGMLTGWVALIVFLALAVTSNNRAVRGMGRNWKRLHNGIYVGIGLTFAHWILTAFDPEEAYHHLGIVTALVMLRLILTFVKRRRVSA